MTDNAPVGVADLKKIYATGVETGRILQAAQDQVFDLLEALKPHFPDIAGHFARDTGGVDMEGILAIVREGLTSGEGLLREALQRIQDEPDHTLPIVTAQRLRNIAGFALLGERLP